MSRFKNEIKFGSTSKLPKPFGHPRYAWFLWQKVNSYVEGNIWYTFQIYVFGRTYMLQQRRFFQVTWKFLPIFNNKTKKFNILIFNKAFQPTRWTNTRRIPIFRHINHTKKIQPVIKYFLIKVRMDSVYITRKKWLWLLF